MVEAYNATMKQLKTTGGIMNEFYQQQLKNIPAGSKESLESIGISQAKDGSLIVDESIPECGCGYLTEGTGRREWHCLQNRISR